MVQDLCLRNVAAHSRSIFPSQWTWSRESLTHMPRCQHVILDLIKVKNWGYLYRRVQMVCSQGTQIPLLQENTVCSQGAQILPHTFALKRKACVCYQWPHPWGVHTVWFTVTMWWGDLGSWDCECLENLSVLRDILLFCRFSQPVALKHRPAAAAGAEKWLPFGFFFSVMLPTWDFSWQLWLQTILDFCPDLKTYCLHMWLPYNPRSSFVISSYQKNTIMC